MLIVIEALFLLVVVGTVRCMVVEPRFRRQGLLAISCFYVPTMLMLGFSLPLVSDKEERVFVAILAGVALAAGLILFKVKVSSGNKSWIGWYKKPFCKPAHRVGPVNYTLGAHCWEVWISGHRERVLHFWPNTNTFVEVTFVFDARDTCSPNRFRQQIESCLPVCEQCMREAYSKNVSINDLDLVRYLNQVSYQLGEKLVQGFDVLVWCTECSVTQTVEKKIQHKFRAYPPPQKPQTPLMPID